MNIGAPAGKAGAYGVRIKLFHFATIAPLSFLHKNCVVKSDQVFHLGRPYWMNNPSGKTLNVSLTQPVAR